MALPPDQRASYSAIIDSILASSDLNTISAKAIRKGLQEKVAQDLTPQKSLITDLIMERFDRFSSGLTEVPPPAPTIPAPAPAPAHVVAAPVTTTNGTDHINSATASSSPGKRKAGDDEDEDEEDLSSVQNSPPPKKVKKAPKTETDEEMAKRMQAELNQQAGRATRGGGPKKKTVVKKDKKKPKKKSAAKVRSDDDSDVESGSEKPEKEKKGGFHKPMNLSPALQELLGESQLSRPQTVKRIWAYVKERDLQQPDDKRNIMCDEKLRAVFKSDKVHMFTMNKILATQLYPADE